MPVVASETLPASSSLLKKDFKTQPMCSAKRREISTMRTRFDAARAFLGDITDIDH